MDDVLTMLREARERLARPYGWCKGSYTQTSYEGHGTSYCAVGALTRWDPRTQQAIEVLAEHVPDAVGWSTRDVVIEFNDRRSTRKKDVLALFDRAIESLEQK